MLLKKATMFSTPLSHASSTSRGVTDEVQFAFPEPMTIEDERARVEAVRIAKPARCGAVREPIRCQGISCPTSAKDVEMRQSGATHLKPHSWPAKRSSERL